MRATFFEQIQVGRDDLADAFDGHQRLKEHRVIGWNSYVMMNRAFDERLDDFAEVDLGERCIPQMHIHQLGDFLLPMGVVDRADPHSDLVQRARHAFFVAQRQVQQQIGHAIFHQLRHAPDEAEVDQTDAPVVEDEQVAGVQIAMEEAVFKDLLEHHAHAFAGDGLHVVSAPDRVGDLAADEALHHQHRVAGCAAVHLGDMHRGPGREVAIEALEVHRLIAEIELFADGALEFFSDGDRVKGLGLGDRRFDLPRDEMQNVQVADDDVANARALDLDDDFFAAQQPRDMHLRDACAGQRDLFDMLEDVLDGPFEGLQQHGLRIRKRDRRDIVLQGRQLIAEGLGHQV